MIWSLPMVGRPLDHLGQRVARLQRRNDALDPGQQLERLQRFVSMIGTYSTRPLSFSQECSGPMPG